jgi:Ca2+-binding EF-hand superfamily protein
MYVFVGVGPHALSALLTHPCHIMHPLSKVAAQNRNKGNASFKAGEWQKAINYYSKSLKVDPTNYIVTSNRSSAHLKLGQKEEALKDAEKCIQLSKTYAKGHARKAMALHAMKKFSDEVNAYKVGLKYCPDDKTLKEGMEKARQSRSSNSKASQAARKTEATLRAAKSRKKKAQTSSSVSQFVKETKKNLELQLAAIQAQLKMVSELAIMGVEEKLDLLYTLMDKDKSGTIDAKELADALRKRNEGLTFGDAIQKSIEMIAIYDEDGDAELDRDEFRHFVERMVSELHATIDEFCEFLVYQILFSQDDDEGEAVDIDQLKDEVRERGQLLDALSDPRMMSLFVLFDRDGDSAVSFKEVACGLYHLTKSMEESAKATTGLLLMMDKDDKRILVYEQFAKLILAIAAAAHTTFDEVADDLTLAMTADGADQMDPHVLKALTIADEEYAQARDAERAEKEQRKVHDALSYGRTLRLFDLWDVDGSGTIDFEVRAK